MSKSTRSLAPNGRTLLFVDLDVVEWVASGLAWDLLKRSYHAVRAKLQRQPADGPIASPAVGRPGYPGQRLAEECDPILLKYMA